MLSNKIEGSGNSIRRLACKGPAHELCGIFGREKSVFAFSSGSSTKFTISFTSCSALLMAASANVSFSNICAKRTGKMDLNFDLVLAFEMAHWLKSYVRVVQKHTAAVLLLRELSRIQVPVSYGSEWI